MELYLNSISQKKWAMMKLPSNNYHWVQTADGSQTLHSQVFGEACHSTSGAKAETILHYIEGCKVQERLTAYPQFQILEVGFGLGIGFLTTLEFLAQSHPWHFVSLEIDADLVRWFLEEYKDLDICQHARWVSENLVEAEFQNIKLSIIVGDAREELPAYLQENVPRFHAIFQDAFSPKRNPVLWTVEWFSLLKDLAHPECILSTYSASSSIRKSLLESGWNVVKGHKFGPKRSSTRAGLIQPSDEDILTHLNNSPVPALYDEDINEFLENQKS